nr:T9SS type A sorting domain-containing protein [Bacteroidota bacterium]
MKKNFMLTVFICLFIGCNAFSQTNLLNGPEGITFDITTKSYFVTNANNGRVIKIDSLQNHSIFYQGLSVPMGIELIGDSLFVASNDPSTISCIDINTGELLGDMTITESPSMAHMDYDPTTGYLYVIGQAGQVFKINTRTLSYNVFVNTGHGVVNGSQTCIVDTASHHLYVFSWPITFVRCVNLNDSSDVQNMVNPLTGQYIDCTKDPDGNIYVASWQGNKIQKFAPDCSVLPEVFATGFNKPAGLVYNPLENVIAVCNFGGNSLSFVSLSVTGINNPHNDASNPMEIELFPNPVKDILTINFKDHPTIDTHIIIFDGYGRQCKKIDIRKNKVVIDLTTMPQGRYVAEIRRGNKVWVKKIIKL